jgi:hypothetical protein
MYSVYKISMSQQILTLIVRTDIFNKELGPDRWGSLQKIKLEVLNMNYLNKLTDILQKII